MRKGLFAVGAILVGAALFALGWISHGDNNKTHISPPVVANKTAPRATPPPTVQPLVSPGDWQHLRAAREAALQANPDLAAEYNQIIDDLKTEEGRFDAAMIKADPKVAPVIAKLAALRQRNTPAPR